MAKRAYIGPIRTNAIKVAPPLVEPHSTTDDEGHPEPHGSHRNGVARVVDPAQIGPQRRNGHPVGLQALARKNIGPVGCFGHHGAEPCPYITISRQVTQPRNTTSETRPLTARSVMASALLGMDPARTAGRPAGSPDRAVRDQREPGSGGPEPDGECRGGHHRRCRPLPARRALGGPPDAAVAQPLRTDRSLRRAAGTSSW